MPYGVLYAATNHAVTGYAEPLDHELRTNGIRVSVVEPACTRTQFDANFLELDEYCEACAPFGTWLQTGMTAGDAPESQVGNDDVLARVRPAGVNLLDAKIGSGGFKLFLPYPRPLILGHDVARAVTRVGVRVRRFRPGDEGHARSADGRIGSFAACIANDQADVANKPPCLTIEEAASLPMVGLPVW